MKWRYRSGWIAVGLTAALLLAAGCSDDDGGQDNSNDNSNHVLYPDSGVHYDSGVHNDSSTPQPDATTGPCDVNGFNAAAELSTYSGGLLKYEAYTSESFPMDRLTVQIYQGGTYNGPTTPGSYTLENGPDSNYQTCGLCPLIFQYSTAGDADRTFYADTGTVEITTIGTVGGTFAATFHNLIFREVTIDWSSYLSTPVPGGQEWCLNGYTFNEPIEDESSACAYPGTCLGDNVADFQVTSCETGNPVSAYSLASGMNALWLVGSHEW